VLDVALPVQVQCYMRDRSKFALTRSPQTLTATVLRLDHPVRSAPRMAAARGPPPHHPPAHPTARRTAQDLPIVQTPPGTLAMIQGDHS
jgi:hypothetical protein